MRFNVVLITEFLFSFFSLFTDPMGPIQLADFVGLDTLSHISKGWRESRVSTGEISADIVQESKLLEDLVSQGRTGKKSEKGGFYPA